MSFRTRRILISTPLVMIFEFFVMKYLFLLFGGLEDLYLILLTIIFGILNVYPMILEKKKSRFLTRVLDEISGIWIFISLFLAIDLIIIYLTNYFIEIPIYIILICLSIIPLITIYSYYKAHKWVINEKNIKLDNLTEDVNIVHLSDVHFGTMRHEKLIKDLTIKLNELSKSCDLAIISGDLADGSCVVEENDFLPLKDVKMPIIFTPGNHDFYPGIENVCNACKKARIIILHNNGLEFKGLNIFGLTFSFDEIETVSTDELKSFIKEDMVNIINFHVPQKWDEFSKIGFDIQLSGHTHGGQFYPVVWIADKIMYNRGLFKKRNNNKNKYLHVTTGVGSMDYPFRWGTNSELVILKLMKN